MTGRRLYGMYSYNSHKIFRKNTSTDLLFRITKLGGGLRLFSERKMTGHKLFQEMKMAGLPLFSGKKNNGAKTFREA